MDTTIVFAGGPVPTATERAVLRRRLSATAVGRIVVADGGLHLVDALGVRLVAGRDVVLGDMDSVDARRLAEVEAEGIGVERHPSDKDATDLELALDDATADVAALRRIVVVGTTAGRFDHVLAGVGALAVRRHRHVERDAWLGTDVVHVVVAGSPRALPMAVGSTFSVLAVHGDADGVTVSGGRWMLKDEHLDAGVGRGVSNRSVEPVVNVSCSDGTLVVIEVATDAEEDL